MMNRDFYDAQRKIADEIDSQNSYCEMLLVASIAGAATVGACIGLIGTNVGLLVFCFGSAASVYNARRYWRRVAQLKAVNIALVIASLQPDAPITDLAKQAEALCTLIALGRWDTDNFSPQELHAFPLVAKGTRQ
jgi:hypothetical protein